MMKVVAVATCKSTPVSSNQPPCFKSSVASSRRLKSHPFLSPIISSLARETTLLPRMAYHVTKWTNVRALCSSFCNATTNDSGFCPAPCLSICPATCQFVLIPPTMPTTTTSSSAYNPNRSYTLDPFFIASFACLAVGLLVMCSYAIYLKYYSVRRPDPRPGQEAQLFGQVVRGESSGLGLPSSVIGAISVQNYNKGDDLFREKECAVCLNEFQDREALRILPKCNHAFHMSCVDVWLASHISCPMCRSCIMSSVTAIRPIAEHHNSPV